MGAVASFLFSFFTVLSQSGGKSRPSSLLIRHPGGVNLMYNASLVFLSCKSLAVSRISASSQLIQCPSCQACLATADFSNAANLQAALCSFILMFKLLPVSPM